MTRLISSVGNVIVVMTPILASIKSVFFQQYDFNFDPCVTLHTEFRRLAKFRKWKQGSIARYSRRLGIKASDQEFLLTTILIGGRVVLKLNMARMTKVFPLYCAVFRASISEEQIRGQEFEELARNLHHITGAMPA